MLESTLRDPTKDRAAAAIRMREELYRERGSWTVVTTPVLCRSLRGATSIKGIFLAAVRQHPWLFLASAKRA